MVAGGEKCDLHIQPKKRNPNWSEATATNFMEAAFSDADIKIGFYIFNDWFKDSIVGDVVLQLEGQDNVRVGEISLDAGKYWALPRVSNNSPWPTGVWT